MNTINKIKKFFSHFFTLDDTPHNIAGGLALGIFLGTLPGMGLVALLVAVSIFKLNKASAIVGVLATNMWGTIIALPFAAMIGGFLFGQSSTHLSQDFQATYNLGLRYFFSKIIFFDLALPLTIGFIATSAIFAAIFYFTIYFLLKYKKIQ